MKKSYRVYVLELKDGSLWCGCTGLVRPGSLLALGVKKVRKSLAAHLPAFYSREEALAAHQQNVANLERLFSKLRVPVRT